MENREECMDWGVSGGSTGHWMYFKDLQGDSMRGRHLGPQQEVGVWESVKCLGKTQLLQPGPVCTCPKREGGRRTSQNATQPASDQPPARGKGGVTENLERLGFKEGGGREGEVGRRLLRLESWNSQGRGRGLGTGIPGLSREVGTKWLIKVQELQIPDSELRQSFAFTPLI